MNNNYEYSFNYNGETCFYRKMFNENGIYTTVIYENKLYYRHEKKGKVIDKYSSFSINDELDRNLTLYALEYKNIYIPYKEKLDKEI